MTDPLQGEQGIQGIQAKVSSVKEMLESDIYLKQELNRMFRSSFRNQLITIILTCICTIAIFIGFIFFFKGPTKIDTLIFKEMEKEKMKLRGEREYIRQQRDSLRVYNKALYDLQQKK